MAGASMRLGSPAWVAWFTDVKHDEFCVITPRSICIVRREQRSGSSNSSASPQGDNTHHRRVALGTTAEPTAPWLCDIGHLFGTDELL